MRSIAKYCTKAAYALSVAGLFALAAPVQAATTFADTPLFLSVNVPPNLVVTIDDSGSMRRAYVPEECGDDTTNLCATLDHRYEKAAYKNQLYYDPTVTYPQPKKYDGTLFTTSFTAAYVNGFDSTSTAVDLSKNFQPTAFFDLGSASGGNLYIPDANSPGNATTHRFMGHNSLDVKCSTSSGAGVCQYKKGGTWTNAPTSTSCNVSSTLSVRNMACTGTGADVTKPPAPMPAYYYVYNGANAGCTGTLAAKKVLDACYTIVYVSNTSGPGNTDERQNYANWYSFWRTRNLAVKSAASLSFADLDPSVRVAWQALNSCNQLPITSCTGYKQTTIGASKANAINTFNGTHKQDFYNWLFQLPTHGTTPLPQAMKNAGEYYKTSGEGSPYDNNFTTTNSGELACRRNYHVMMTDGEWNVGVSASTPDELTKTLPEPSTKDSTINTYTTTPVIHPYYGSDTNTLADIAFQYWVTDLRSTLTDNVKPLYRDISGSAYQQTWNPRNDPATWQHMVNFTIGLGLSDYLTEAGLTWTGDMYGGSYSQLAAGTLNWPSAHSSPTFADVPGNVADLWHAALNSRGQFFSADNPSALAGSFKAALTAISSNPGSAAALSTNSTSLQPNDTLVYQAKFAEGWSGQLLALPVQANGQVSVTPKWDAGALIPAFATPRKAFSYNGTSGIVFNSAACGTTFSAAQTLALNTNASFVVDGLCAKRVDYLNGDASYEVRNSGAFRNRFTTVMGDIINSDPAYVKNTDYGYANMPAGTPGQSSYASYVSASASRLPMVYVGANDGHLYGIRADVDQVGSGVEQFSYIPNGVFNNLSLLTDPSYSHHYYVDGPVTAGDAYIGPTPATATWKTVVLGGLNAGGKSIFALDVSNPTSFNASNVMWEFTDANMGLSFSQPQIGVLQNGTWVAIFGNGYNSPTGGAILYIVDLQTGTLLKKITASDIAGDETNGLSTPLLYDSNNDHLIDTIYAGDLKGHMWKFDVSGATVSTWGVAFSGSPLFTALGPGDVPQPITSQPAAGAHPQGGTLVYFGTGRYLTTGDITDMSVQTFYSVRDNGAAIASSTRAQIASSLQQQSFTSQFSLGVGLSGRTLSSTQVDYGTKQGFYLDLLGPPPTNAALGERVVSRPINPKSLSDRVIFVTMIPSTDPCVPGGSSWLLEVDAVNGGAVLNPDHTQKKIIDTNGDGVVNDSDQVTAGVMDTGLGISKTPVTVDMNNPNQNITVKEMTGTGDKITGVLNLGSTNPNPPPPPSPPLGTVIIHNWIEIK